MQSTPVEASPQADFGDTTIVTRWNARYLKLLRFRALKRELAELRAEYALLEKDLFGEGAS
jgi:hypothetical protein